jgi:predicted transposase YbfD/YdcC
VTDPRDNRGKRHDFHFVLFGVLLAAMAGKVLIAEIHRFLARHHACLCALLDVEQAGSISDTQLRRLLALVDNQPYQHFHASYFGWQASLLPTETWVSLDGKELGGTVDGVGGQKRGLCLVKPLLHYNSIGLPGLFYHGAKESEINCVRWLLKDENLANKRVTFDALHTQHETLEMVQNAQGIYVAQVKANQAMLLEDLQDHIRITTPDTQRETWDKGHGRIEQRKTSFYSVNGVCFEKKWGTAGLATLIVVERNSRQCRTGKVSRETSYYVSNATTDRIPPEDLVLAIRQHWAIEADHWVRDCTFREDRVRCQEPARSKTLASIISVAGNLLRQQKKGFLKAMQEDIACKPALAMTLFRHTDIL